MLFNNRPVWTSDTFTFEKAEIGDYVEQDIVDDIVGLLPPAYISDSCAQLGEPYTIRRDPETGKHRETYATFMRAAENIWKYCGHCFRGETTERI